MRAHNETSNEARRAVDAAREARRADERRRPEQQENAPERQVGRAQVGRYVDVRV